MMTFAEKDALYRATGGRILKLRTDAGLSQGELAKRCGVTQSLLSSIECGKSPCPMHLLVMVAEEFDVTLDDLVPVVTGWKEAS